MHPNPAFRQDPTDTNLAFARQRSFGTLSLNADPAPLISHVPFLLNADGSEAEMHLVRSNPIARMVTEPTPAVIAVLGPDGYVSPDWYGDPAQVPTWNYIAVHLRGVLRPVDPAGMRDHVDRLSAQFETQLAPKPPWTADKMPEDALARMMRQILPFRFAVEEVNGTWKLNQNKSDEARALAAAEIAKSPIGQELAALSDHMAGARPK